MDAKPGVYFENHFLKSYGLWDTSRYSKSNSEIDEVIPITDIDCEKDY